MTFPGSLPSEDGCQSVNSAACARGDEVDLDRDDHDMQKGPAPSPGTGPNSVPCRVSPDGP